MAHNSPRIVLEEIFVCRFIESVDEPAQPTPRQVEFLRLWRLSGWKNRSQAARELGISPSTVSRYLDLKIDPALPVLKMFAGRLGVALELPAPGKRLVDLRDAPRALEPWEQEFLHLLQQLRPEARRKAVASLIDLIECLNPEPQSPPDQTGFDKLIEAAKKVEEDGTEAVRSMPPPSVVPPVSGGSGTGARSVRK